MGKFTKKIEKEVDKVVVPHWPNQCNYPNCSKSTIVANIVVIDNTTGEQLEGAFSQFGRDYVLDSRYSFMRWETRCAGHYLTNGDLCFNPARKT